MNRKTLATYRKRLVTLGKTLGGDRALLMAEALQPTGGETSGSFSDIPLHPADLGSHHAEEVMTLALLENEEKLIEEINLALARIEEGTFGRCEVCSRPIALKRLDVLPYTRLCIRCARKVQREATG